MANSTFLVVGLGNPGSGYSGNRHNVGQMVLAVLADRLAKLGVGADAPKVILARSNGYMNTSGGPVSGLAKFYGVPAAAIIVIHDELDIPAADVRIKVGGGHAGHNGLRDIISALGGPDFVRVRVGIGRPPGQMDTADFVLRDFGTSEKKELPVTLEIAADAVEAIIKDGVTAAQLRFHSA